MKEEKEFQQIGKATPYKVPEGFFEQFSEKTLQKAKQREAGRRKKMVLWSSVSVAASVSVFFVAGYLITGHQAVPQPDALAKQVQPVGQKAVQPAVGDTLHLVEKEASKPVVAEAHKPVPEKNTVQLLAKEPTRESLDDVLSSMSDEDLMMLAAMYDDDQYIEAMVE